MKTTFVLAAALFCLASSVFASASDVKKIEIWDQRVAIVNTEAISKRDVEERMGEIAMRLQMFKKQKTAEGQWNADAEAEWTRLYVESFRDALRKIVRERLMLQHFVMDKLTVDDKTIQKRKENYLNMIKSQGGRVADMADLNKRVKEAAMIEEFKGKFDNALEYPKKPEVEKCSQDHIDNYQRKAGTKVRLIRIDINYTDKLTGQRKIRENARDYLEDIRHDIVELGALFSEVAKTKNDDLELKERGGLMLAPDNDPYIVIDEQNKIVAAAIRNLEVGKVTPVFNYGASSFAIAMVEDRRSAGPAPLEGKLYEKIYNEMYENKRLKREDEWFRATLAKTLVMQIVEGNSRPLPIDFFFPDDKKNPDLVSDGGKTDAKKDDKKDDKRK